MKPQQFWIAEFSDGSKKIADYYLDEEVVFDNQEKPIKVYHVVEYKALTNLASSMVKSFEEITAYRDKKHFGESR